MRMDEIGHAYADRGAAAMLTKERDLGQIPRELERQQEAGVELHNMVSRLEERLEAIRLAKPETAASPERDHPEPIRADLAQAIANGTSQITTATRRLQTLLHELEV